jgi:large subunit ribosomal protein L25
MSPQADQITLSAGKRTVIGKHVKQLRQEGWVPGVMYGHGFDSVSLKFEERNLTRLLSRVGGSQLIQIDVEGAKEPEMALVRDVQRDPIRGSVLHVDFYRVQMTERLTAEIPVQMEGESPIIALNEGILLQGISAIEVECLPGDLVDSFVVDLADLLEVDDSITVGDLAIPAGIDVLTDLDELIVRVAPLAEEEVLEEIVEEELLLDEDGEVIVEGEEGEEEAADEEGEEE